MKLAELLIERHDLLDLIAGLENRLRSNLRIQEGDTINEDPDVLMDELNKLFERLIEVKKSINDINVISIIEENVTLNDLIVKQQVLKKKHRVIFDIIEGASTKQRRYSNSEIREVVVIDVKRYIKELDLLAKQIRELDVKLQKLNWEIEVS